MLPCSISTMSAIFGDVTCNVDNNFDMDLLQVSTQPASNSSSSLLKMLQSSTILLCDNKFSNQHPPILVSFRKKLGLNIMMRRQCFCLKRCPVCQLLMQVTQKLCNLYWPSEGDFVFCWEEFKMSCKLLTAEIRKMGHREPLQWISEHFERKSLKVWLKVIGPVRNNRESSRVHTRSPSPKNKV